MNNNNLSEKLLWTAVAAGAGYATSRLVDAAARKGWQQLRGSEPPERPESSETSWPDALLWTAVASLMVGLGQLLATRAAAAGYEKLAGHRPPV
jgi:uncharacterized membrane protein YedE/YeeE